MSEAQDVSDQSDRAPVATDLADLAVIPEEKAQRSHSGRWIRLVATLGALVFAYAMWLPWAIVTEGLGDRFSAPVLIDPSIAFASNLVKVGGYIPTPEVVAAFSMLGVLLAPLLWRPADSLLGAIASHIFGLWVIFASLFIVEFGFSPFISGTPQPANGLEGISIVGHIAPGFWLAVVALIGLWVAVIGLLVNEWRRHVFWHLLGNDLDAPRSFVQLPGAAVLNLGLIIWAAGFLMVGWASLNCNQAPLLAGSCQGVPASSALSASIALATTGVVFHSTSDPQMLFFLDPNIARHAIGILLGVGAVLIFLGVWLRVVTRVFCVWTTLWLVAAVATVGLAYSGVGLIVAHPARYGLPAGTWSAESGVFITLLGLIIAIAGLATLSVAALRKTAE
ncbi:MAG TPA: hypothetical protein VFU69_13510 [Ktedonobacterales bacterium]|nr:hypothetical protein [Ktedonobacterales bacterium]